MCARGSRGPSLPAVLLTLLVALACSPPDDPRPDLLLVTVDTLRPDRLACYGGAPDVGTALCGASAGGTRFAWAFATSPSTAPSVASILTSRYPSQHGVTQLAITRLAGQATTLAELLRDAGYATAAFVCNPVLGRNRRLDQGFEIYDVTLTRRERNRPGLFEREAASATEAALAWVRVAATPWFLWVHYQDPHGPYDPPDLPLPGRDPRIGPALPLLADHSGLRGIPAYQVLPGLRSLGAYERRYLEEIRYLDGHVARLLHGVGSRGRPVGVLISADHGEAFGEDDYYLAHGHSVGLDQIRVPLLWRPPGGAAEALVRTPVSTVDIAPTLLETAGVAVPEGFEGRPLPASEPEPGAALRILYAEHRHRAALLAGPVYYARDRRSLRAPLRDRISGGTLHPLPPRVARLSGGEALPAYEAFAEQPGAGPLEAVLARFLASAPEREGPPSGSLPDGVREQLRTLGYLE